jgi:chromosome segregation ATPase
LKAANQQLAEWDAELNRLHEREGDLGLEVQNLKEELATVKRDRDENKKSAPAEEDFPDDFELLDQLRTENKKSKATPADVKILRKLLKR